MINHSDQKFKLNINKSEKKHQSKCAPEINQIQPIKSQHLLKSTQFNHYKLKFKTISRGFGVSSKQNRECVLFELESLVSDLDDKPKAPEMGIIINYTIYAD